MPLQHPLHNRQSQTIAPCAAVATGVQTDKRLKNPCPLGFGDAVPIIIDQQTHAIPFTCGGDVDGVLGIACGIAEQVR